MFTWCTIKIFDFCVCLLRGLKRDGTNSVKKELRGEEVIIVKLDYRIKVGVIIDILRRRQMIISHLNTR